MKRVIITILLLQSLCTFSSAGDIDDERRLDATSKAASDLLELSFNTTFALAEHVNREEARLRVNRFALRYYLLCHGSKAILPPDPEIYAALMSEKIMRLSREELLEDPLFWELETPKRRIKLFQKSGGRAYNIITTEEYNAIISDFHKWLEALDAEHLLKDELAHKEAQEDRIPAIIRIPFGISPVTDAQTKFLSAVQSIQGAPTYQEITDILGEPGKKKDTVWYYHIAETDPEGSYYLGATLNFSEERLYKLAVNWTHIIRNAPE